MLRLVAAAPIAAIAAWVSYSHMAGVAARYGETEAAAAYLLPLSVDGLVVVASVSLVEITGRLRAATPPRSAAAPGPAAAEQSRLGDATLHVPLTAGAGSEATSRVAPRRSAPACPEPAERTQPVAPVAAAALKPRIPHLPSATTQPPQEPYRHDLQAVDDKGAAPAGNDENTSAEVGERRRAAQAPPREPLVRSSGEQHASNEDAVPTNTAAAVAYWHSRDPELHPSQVAARIGRSERTVRRYWPPRPQGSGGVRQGSASRPSELLTPPAGHRLGR
ncbi:DUF2637 domain-containing protein [Micromonospora sp. 4G55]|uniref:DUF2637 domain-containing protein n=1 Tax=Micromonospora sp. 4G55 TaxID=2806102 RepID=UPI0035C69D53